MTARLWFASVLYEQLGEINLYQSITVSEDQADALAECFTAVTVNEMPKGPVAFLKHSAIDLTEIALNFAEGQPVDAVRVANDQG